MIITKKAIPRRAVLRGLGVSLALPFLDAMVPALTAMPLDALIESWLSPPLIRVSGPHTRGDLHDET